MYNLPIQIYIIYKSSEIDKNQGINTIKNRDFPKNEKNQKNSSKMEINFQKPLYKMKKI